MLVLLLELVSELPPEDRCDELGADEGGVLGMVEVTEGGGGARVEVFAGRELEKRDLNGVEMFVATMKPFW